MFIKLHRNSNNAWFVYEDKEKCELLNKYFSLISKQEKTASSISFIKKKILVQKQMK